MFDNKTTYTFRGPREIIHKRAPTDESVRIYGEMLEAARKQVTIEAIPARNVFGSVVAFQDSDRCQSVVAFELNGEKIRVPIDDYERLTGTDALKVVADAIARRIVERMR